MAPKKTPIKKEAEKKGITVKKANRYIGQPVCVLLNNGECYVGTVQAIHDHQLLLSESRSCGRVKPSNRSKSPEVQVSGLLDTLIGGIGALNSLGTMAASLFKPNVSGPSFVPGTGVQKQEASVGPLGPAGGGQDGFYGSFQQMLPTIQFGLNMVKSIMPLMGMFKI
ncbi:hypothetical protein [Paenibacillus xylaniclasticus]|uniref:hypothetical protein n=1 Tax=Paenibacillus xylaniclasticus TaxID=588083 RepID=UPI000FDAFB0A|nr:MULTISPECIES: hypothetical protein [Paenibacillus]GFN32292.1 hypothetical protein PCURB6_25520 [Paenibacillus curdlanolyticus]